VARRRGAATPGGAGAATPGGLNANYDAYDAATPASSGGFKRQRATFDDVAGGSGSGAPPRGGITDRSGSRGAAKTRRDSAAIVPHNQQNRNPNDVGDEDHMEALEGGHRGDDDDPGAELVNCYDGVNLVRSDLIREFEARGVKVAHLEREVEELAGSLAAAEEAKVRAEAEAARSAAARQEMERQRSERANERAEERATEGAEAEAAVSRSAALEAELASANAKLAAAETSKAAAWARAQEAEARALDAEATGGNSDATRVAAAEAAAAAAESKAASLDAQLREAVLEAGQAAAARSELERRLEDTEVGTTRHHPPRYRYPLSKPSLIE